MHTRTTVTSYIEGRLKRHTAAATTTEGMAPSSILMLHNVAKKKNFGELIRTAAAMGVRQGELEPSSPHTLLLEHRCFFSSVVLLTTQRVPPILQISEIVVVGANKLFTQGCHGTAGFVKFSHFNFFQDAVSYVKNVHGASLCGVEICDDAKPVHKHPFSGECTAFLMGNEGQGLTEAQIKACDQFVYIPQHSDATASLNVNAACAVVLHHYAVWAQMAEAPRAGYKFVQGNPGQSDPQSDVGLKKMRTLNADGSYLAPRKRRGEGGDGSGGESGDDGVADGAMDAGAGESSLFAPPPHEEAK